MLRSGIYHNVGALGALAPILGRCASTGFRHRAGFSFSLTFVVILPSDVLDSSAVDPPGSHAYHDAIDGKPFNGAVPFGRVKHISEK